MKIAVIDIGSHSSRLLISDYYDDRLVNKEKIVRHTKLGSKSYLKNVISEEKIHITAQIIEEFVNIAKNKNVDKIFIFATSAVRNAENKKDFVDIIYQKTKIKLEIISGDEEAQLSYIGVLKGTNLNNISAEQLMVIDLGGGSLEIILGDLFGNILKKYSFDIGVIRFSDKFRLNVLDNDLKFRIEELKLEVKKGLDKEFFDYKENFKNVKIMPFSVSGSISALIMTDLKIEKFESKKIINHKLYKKNIEKILNEICYLPLDEKTKIKGVGDRAEVIVASALIILEIMQYFNIDFLQASESDNLEGFFYAKNKNN